MKKIIFILLLSLMLTETFSPQWFGVQTISAQETKTESEDEEDELKGFEDEEDDELEGFGDEEDDELEGFGDEDETKESESEDAFGEIKIDLSQTQSAEPELFSFGGFVKEELNYSYQETDSDFAFTRKEAELNKIRSVLNLSLDFNLPFDWKVKISGNAFYDAYYSKKDRDDFTDETLRVHETEAELRDTFIDGSIIDDLQIKVGRQIIAWGESEGPPIVDIANPRDNRELGLVDIEDARIPILSTKLSYFANEWEFNVVAIHEFRPNKRAGAKSDFDPYISIRDSSTINDDELPGNPSPAKEFETEWLARIVKSFNGGDVSLIYADVYEDDAFLDFDLTTFSFTPKYQRITMIGISGNIASGSWLFKTEIAKKNGVAYFRNDLTDQITAGSADPQSSIQKNILQGMLGFDNTDLTDLTITFEVSATQIEDYETSISSEEVSASPSIVMRYSIWNDTLKPSLFFVQLPNENGNLIRLSADYDVIDALTVSGGIADYNAAKDENFLYPYRNNDRAFASVKYSF